jgi:hypothetical protein
MATPSPAPVRETVDLPTSSLSVRPSGSGDLDRGGAPMSDHGRDGDEGVAEEVVDDVEGLVAPDDDSAAGSDMAPDGDG